MGKRFIAFILTLTMVFSLIPQTVFAAEETADGASGDVWTSVSSDGAAVPDKGLITAFEPFADAVRYQRKTIDELEAGLPQTVAATVDNAQTSVPVSWDGLEDARTYGGLSVLNAVIPEGFTVSNGVELPKITAFVVEAAPRLFTSARRDTLIADSAGINAMTESAEGGVVRYTEEQLREISELSNVSNTKLAELLYGYPSARVKLKLANDISLSSVAFTPISKGNTDCFTGDFDGNGKKISGLTINSTDYLYVGLFSSLFNATVKDLWLEDVNIVNSKDSGCAGGIVGEMNSSTISGCFVTGSISGGGLAGGIAGSANDSSTIENCGAMVNVSALYEEYAHGGGIVGAISSGTSVLGCFATGSVNCLAADCYGGGI